MSKKPIVIIFLTVFIDLIGFGIIIPLSPYLAREFGASPFEIGLLMAIYSGMQFLFSPVWGRWSDRLGRRPILLVSVGGTALAHFLFYLAPSLTFLFLARALAGFFSANISTAMAYIADVTPAQSRSKSMGLIGAAFGLGFICGPALGGLTAPFGESAPALAAAIISSMNFIFTFVFLKESLPQDSRKIRQRSSRLQNIFNKIKRPVVGTLLLAQFLTALAMANMEAAMFLFMKDRFEWGVQESSYGFAYVGLCIAFTQGFLVRKLLPRYGERVLLVVGLVVFTLSMFLIGISQSIPLLALAMTLLALGNGFINPAISGGISLLTEASEQGEVMGVSQSMAALARILGPPVGGFIYSSVAITSPFFLACGLGLIGFIFIFGIRHRLPNEGKIQSHSVK